MVINSKLKMLVNTDLCEGSACAKKCATEQIFTGQGAEYSMPGKPQQLLSREQEPGDATLLTPLVPFQGP